MTMIIAIEILIVIAAFIVLGISGIKLVKKAVSFGRTIKTTNEHTHPRIMALMTQSEMASQRVFSIIGNVDLMQRRTESLRITMGRFMIVINAIGEGSDKLSRGMRILGF